MTVLQELASLYDRRADVADWPRPGFSSESIGAVVVLAEDGSVTAIRSLMSPDAKGKKLVARKMAVPAPPADRRGKKIVPGLFWDPTPYSLGVSEDGDELSFSGNKADIKNNAFREAHIAILDGVDDPAMMAFRQFCKNWSPEMFTTFPDVDVLIGENVVFQVNDGPFLHELPTAKTLAATSGSGGAICLVSGRASPIARLHPSIKGVMGAQTAGARLVSFNSSAYESHGKSQGDNAPVSEAAAFAYGTALNALLARGSGNNMRIGDATVAFWARGPGEDAAENALAAAFGMDRSAQVSDAEQRDEGGLRARLEAVAQGRVPPGTALDPATRVFVLGLAPNAARLSVRFWYPGTFGDFAANVVRFWEDCAIAPSPFARDGVELPPRPWALLFDLAAQRDGDNIPASLGGEMMRAILTGGRYPATLLPTVIGRLRVEGEPDRARHGNVDGRRAALIRAALKRNHSMEVPVALDEDATDVAYLLGRLFGAYAYAERSYQERGAGLRQKYMGAASATPARVFPVLMRGYEHNLDSLRKAGGQKSGSGVRADRAVSAIIAGLPGGGDLPSTLPLEAQGRFFIGFYHQTASFFAKAEDAADPIIDTDGNTSE